MKTILIIACCMLSMSMAVPASSPTVKPLRTVANSAFGTGEVLEYNVGYKFVTAGTARFKVAPATVQRDGAECYDITFDVASRKALDYLYRVRDQYRTLVDVSGLYPVFFEQHIREGGYKRDFSATFDQKSHKARTTEGVFDIEPFTHDVVSAFYYLRTQNLRSFGRGDTVKLKNFFDKKTYDLNVVVLGRQTIEVEAGRFRCIVVEPIIAEGGLFKSDGKILIWLSDDDRKIPVKVSTKIPIGSIDSELTGYSGLKGPLSAKLPDED